MTIFLKNTKKALELGSRKKHVSFFLSSFDPFATKENKKLFEAPVMFFSAHRHLFKKKLEKTNKCNSQQICSRHFLHDRGYSRLVCRVSLSFQSIGLYGERATMVIYCCSILVAAAALDFQTSVA